MTRRHRTESGFTMVEIAFSLAIVAFALVAIMGVLPTGMTVQKDNREDTLINNDAAFWTEAMRSGSRGLNDLLNHVEEIKISNSKGASNWTATWVTPAGQFKLTSSEQIMGLLSTPKYFNDGGKILTNVVTARVRALNGPAITSSADNKAIATNGAPSEFAFRYQMEPELTPVFPAPIDTTSANDPYRFWTEPSRYAVTTADGYNWGNIPYHLNVATNLQNLRLTLRWPLFEQGTTWGVGRNHRTVRALVNGQWAWTPRDEVEGHTNYHLPHPNLYQYASDISQLRSK